MNAKLVMGVATILGAFDATGFAAALPSLGNRQEVLLQWRDPAVCSDAHESASEDSHLTTVEPSIYGIVDRRF